MEIGLNLYNLREFCQTEEGLFETLRKVADIGYKNVQISGTCRFDAEKLRAELDRDGLRAVLTHTPPDRLTLETDAVASEHGTLGCRYAGLGMFRFDENTEGMRYADFLKTYRPGAKKLRERGLYFMYHNHDGEFQKIGGKTILQRLAEDMAPADMGFILDTFWVQAGGGDPAAWIDRLTGRVPCIHLKDYAYGRKFAVIGEGNINFDRVFLAAENAGTLYMLVEQDDSYGEDPFDCARRSYRNLRTFGFE